MHKLLIITLTLSSLFAQTPEQLFDAKCASCHVKTHPSELDKSTLIAPPAFGVMKHVSQAFNNDKEQTVAFIKEYALNPSIEKAKCQPHAIKRFGLMPSQKDLVTSKELEEIANYMYDSFASGATCKNKN
jgi:mono/diheme cytochrome c family protein